MYEGEKDMSITNYVRTIDFGEVPIRRSFTDGEEQAWIELSGDEFVSIRLDPRTNQPFAVLFDEDCNQL